MVVDIKVKQVASYTVASLIHYGPHASNMLRAEFIQLVKWAKKNNLRSGKWVMRWLDEPGKKPASRMRSEACLEIIKGNAKPEGRIQIKKFHKHTVASVVFDPSKVSAHLVYFGIYGWVRYSEFEATDSPPREVYSGNPWTSPHAWSNAEVQVPIKRR
jgi:DNA gyrase inhibitor GyrI